MCDGKNNRNDSADRRKFLKTMMAAGLSIPLASCGDDAGGGGTDTETGTGLDTGSGQNTDTGTGEETDTGTGEDGNSVVHIFSAADRVTALEGVLGMTGLGFAAGRDILIKPNFNSAPWRMCQSNFF